MTICVKPNETGPQYTCQLKKNKIKEERLYFLNCQFGSTTLKTWAHYQVDSEHKLNFQHSGHLYKVSRATGVLKIRIKLKCLSWQCVWQLAGLKSL